MAMASWPIVVTVLLTAISFLASAAVVATQSSAVTIQEAEPSIATTATILSEMPIKELTISKVNVVNKNNSQQELVFANDNVEKTPSTTTSNNENHVLVSTSSTLVSPEVPEATTLAPQPVVTETAINNMVTATQPDSVRPVAASKSELRKEHATVSSIQNTQAEPLSNNADIVVNLIQKSSKIQNEITVSTEQPKLEPTIQEAKDNSSVVTPETPVKKLPQPSPIGETIASRDKEVSIKSTGQEEAETITSTHTKLTTIFITATAPSTTTPKSNETTSIRTSIHLQSSKKEVSITTAPTRDDTVQSPTATDGTSSASTTLQVSLETTSEAVTLTKEVTKPVESTPDKVTALEAHPSIKEQSPATERNVEGLQSVAKLQEPIMIENKPSKKATDDTSDSSSKESQEVNQDISVASMRTGRARFFDPDHKHKAQKKHKRQKTERLISPIHGLYTSNFFRHHR